MRSWQVFLAVGAVALSIGITSTLSGVLPGTIRTTLTIPPGAEWHFVFEFVLFGGGGLHVEYRELVGRAVDTFVFNKSQYNVYLTGGFPTTIRSIPNSAGGSFNVFFPGSGTFVLVFDHGASFEAIEQPTDAEITASGIRPIPSMAGAVFLAIGAILEVLSSWRKQNPGPPRPSLPPREVVMFEEPKGPRRPLPPLPPRV